MQLSNIVFMGSPDFALPVLEKLAGSYHVVGVVTQPDRPAGRGQALTPPPVKELAISLGIPVIQPPRLRDPGVMEQIQDWKPDLIVVAAFGQILRKSILSIPQLGCVNVHASLLPRWRGASPVQAAILAGDLTSGVTIMQMDEGLDTGPILAQKAIPILETDTSGTLGSRLSVLGADLLVDTLPGLSLGNIIPLPQDLSKSTYAPMIKKEQGLLDFMKPAVDLSRFVRAFQPWPGAFFELRGQQIKVIRASALTGEAIPGQKTIIEGKPALGCKGGWLVIDELQPAGKKVMTGKEYLRGARHWQEEAGS